MHLARALGVRDRDVVTFTGAGGKTTAMLRLAQELAAAGRRVVVTTTAKLGGEQLPLPPVIAESEADLPAAVTRALGAGPIVAVVEGPAEGEPKWRGIASVQVARLGETPGVDFVLVEGDGARGLPLKAPAEHEPVVPECTTLLVPMAGALALGGPVDAEHVHRPELVARFGEWEPRAERVVTAELMAALLASPAGGMKGRPAQARAVALINQCDGGRLAPARPVAEALLRSKAMEAVLLGAVGAAARGAGLEASPVFERHVRVSALVLAAGASTRFGRPKQLIPWGPDGVPLLTHVIRRVRAARGLSEVGVVVGDQAEEILERAVLDRSLRRVWNRDWAEGLSASLRSGLSAVREDAGAVVFVLGDQPGVTPELVEALIDRHRETAAPVVVPRVPGGRRGNPTLWDRAAFDGLMRVRGDTGGRTLIEAYAQRGEVAWVDWTEEILEDIDVPGDLERC